MDTGLLKQILFDHQKLFEKLNDSVKRGLNFDDYLKSNQIIVISGVRRSGKSTLMKTFSKRITKVPVYIRFDDIRFLDFQNSDFQNLEEVFVELYGSDVLLCFDEVQEIVGWEKWVNDLHAKGYRILVTGSNSKLLSSEFSTYITGRHKVVELFPFSFKELVLFNNFKLDSLTTQERGKIKSLFNNFFDKGGFPDVFLYDDLQLLSQYVEDILVKDVIVRHQIKQKKELKDLVLHLLSNAGKTFSYRSLKSITQIQSFSTIKNYIDVVCETFLIFLVPKYDVSLKKQLVSSSKVYCIDLGILNNVAFRFSENKGRSLENLVFLQLKRHGHDIYYHKIKRECDFVIKTGLNITMAIQVCYDFNANNKTREIKGLLEACKTHKLKKGLILTYDKEDSFEQDGVQIEVSPVWKWLLKK